MTSITLTRGTESVTLESSLPLWRIENAIALAGHTVKREAEEQTRKERTLAFRTERQRIAGKLKKAGIKVASRSTQYDRYPSWDATLQSKDGYFSIEKLGTDYSITFRTEELALKGVLALRSVEGLTFTEDIREVKSFGETQFTLKRFYTVTLKGE